VPRRCRIVRRKWKAGPEMGPKWRQPLNSPYRELAPSDIAKPGTHIASKCSTWLRRPNPRCRAVETHKSKSSTSEKCLTRSSKRASVIAVWS
jgi:hypothetical protein